jgi:Ca-activated chloride channel family protein
MRHGRTQRTPRKVGAARLAASALPPLLLLVLLLAPSRARAQAQAGAAAAEAGGRVSVLFTALGKDGEFVNGLRAEDVRVSVDGAPREVLELKRQTGVPLLLAVVIDTSASQEGLLSTTRMAAEVFVRGMMEPGVDEAAVVTFAGETVLEQGLTGDVDRVRAAIGRVRFVPPPGYLGRGAVVVGPPSAADIHRAGATGLWDAVWVVSNEVLPRSLGPGRRVMLLVTDGVDTSSRVKSDKAVEAALQSEVVVYAVGMGDDRNFDGVDKSPLRRLASRTGGRAFFPGKVKELTEIFIRISRELTSQYVLTFAAPTGARDGSFHKLKIEPASPALRGAGVQLSHPQGFYAGNAPTAVRQ